MKLLGDDIIAIYFVNMIIMALLGIPFFVNRKIQANNKKSFLICAFILNFIFVGLRGQNVGADTLVYMEGFELIKSLPINQIFSINYNFEPGYIVLNKLISFVFPNPHSIIIFTSFVSLGSIYIFVYRYSKMPWLSIFIFNTIGGIFQLTTFVRQYLALSVLLFTVPLIKKRKIVPLMFLVIVAFSFHKTSILFILVYLISNIKLDKTTFTIYFVGLGVLYIGIDFVLPFVLNNFYSGYLQMEEWLSQTGGFKFLILHGILLFALIYLGKYGGGKTKLYNMYIAMEMILFAIFFASLKLGLISRLMVTFEPIILLVIPEIIQRIKGVKVQTAITIICCFAFVFFSYILLKNTYIHNWNYSFMWN